MQTHNGYVFIGDVGVKGELHVMLVVDALSRGRVRAKATKNTNILTFQLISSAWEKLYLSQAFSVSIYSITFKDGYSCRPNYWPKQHKMAGIYYTELINSASNRLQGEIWAKKLNSSGQVNWRNLGFLANISQ